MLVPLLVLAPLRVLGAPLLVCNSSDQLDLLQISSPEVAVKHAKKMKMKKVRMLDSETRYGCFQHVLLVLELVLVGVPLIGKTPSGTSSGHV